MTEKKKVRIFHTGGIYGPLDTAEGRLDPQGYLDVDPELSKKLCGAYRHVKLADEVLPGAKDPKDSKEIDALKKEIEDLNKRGEEMSKRFEESSDKKDAALKDGDEKAKAAEALLAASEKSEKALKGALGEFLKTDEKKLKALQKKYADAAKEPGPKK